MITSDKHKIDFPITTVETEDAIIIAHGGREIARLIVQAGENDDTLEPIHGLFYLILHTKNKMPYDNIIEINT